MSDGTHLLMYGEGADDGRLIVRCALRVSSESTSLTPLGMGELSIDTPCVFDFSFPKGSTEPIESIHIELKVESVTKIK